MYISLYIAIVCEYAVYSSFLLSLFLNIIYNEDF